MFLGMIGSIAYGSYCVKKEIETGITDHKVIPSRQSTNNQTIIKENFVDICKRSGIRLSKEGCPLDIKQCHKGQEYLQYKGFRQDDVDFFKELYAQKHNSLETIRRDEITKKHNQMLQTIQNNTRDSFIVFRREYYGIESAEERMKKLMNNKLWNEMVTNYTHIRGSGMASFCEVWTLDVPHSLFPNDMLDSKKNEVYEEVCWIEGLHDGHW